MNLTRLAMALSVLSLLLIDVLAEFCTYSNHLNAQSITVQDQTGTAIGTNHAVGNANRRVQYIYTPAELLAAGAPSGGGSISEIGWSIVANTAGVALGNYTIGMLNANPNAGFNSNPNATWSINGTQLTIHSIDENSLGPGRILFGAGQIQQPVCCPNNYISANGTGTGGVGTYTLGYTHPNNVSNQSGGITGQIPGYHHTAFTTVKNAFNYTPTPVQVGSYDLIPLDNPFAWDGSSNLIVEVCYSVSGSPTTPTMRSINANSSRRFASSCTADLTSMSLGNNIRPWILLNFSGASSPGCTAPTQQATNIASSNIAQSTATVNWTNGNGAGRVVYINTTNSFTPPANGSNPTANTTYAGGQQCIFNGTGSGPVNVTGLVAGTQYYVRVYEYCSPDRAYNTQTATGNPNDFTTQNAACSVPTQQALNIAFSNIAQTTATVNWTNGNGAGRVVYINTTNSFTPPANGSNPTANTTYAGGQQCIFNGTGSGPVNVTGLVAGTQYYVRVYEYCSPDRNYNTQTATGNPNDFTTLNATCTAPSQQALNVVFSNVAQTTATVNWTNGNGAGRVAFINTTNSFIPPANGNNPTANTAYSGGQQCIFNGVGGGPVNVTGLTAGTQYYVIIYEYCSPDRNYTTQTATGNPNDFTTLSPGGPCIAPQTQASQIQNTNVTSTTADISWTSGSGNGRAVFLNTSNTFTPPANGSLPTASTTFSGGQQCIYTGAGSGPVAVSGLTPNTQYFVRVYEYCEPDYAFATQTATNNPSGFTTTDAQLNIFPSTVQNLNYTEGFGPSGSQSYNISGSNLLGSGVINVQANANLEVSSDNSSFSANVSLPYSGGLITGQPITLYVRLKSGLSAGQYFGETLIHSGGSAGPAILTADGEVFGNNTSVYTPETMELLAYPNPAVTSALISWYQPGNEILSIRVYSPEGRELYIYEQPFETGNAHFELERKDLPAGIYLVQLTGKTSGKQIQTKIQWVNR